jgi:4-diphosphocytidyl-2C-methyl-D-erythritol kinase
MSGSGSSLFTLFDEREEAIDAAQRIVAAYGVRAIAVELAPMIEDDLAP